MAAAASPATLPPTVKQGPQQTFAENIVFKSYPELLLPSPLGNGETLKRSTSHSLAVSHKWGVLIVAGQEELVVLRIEDLLKAQSQAQQKAVELDSVPHFFVKSIGGSSPVLVGVSNGEEEYLAIDTVRDGGVPFVLIFNLEQFLTQKGMAAPIVEIRASAQGGSKVRGLAWNPGDNMSSMMAINCDDGTLQLATIKKGSVEICSFKGSAMSMCWSPKGKQLVVGLPDGSICQLKLDLSPAKKTPPPSPKLLPTSIFWVSTTQFLVSFVGEGKEVDFMQLDLVKGTPPSYTSFGDIFISEMNDALPMAHFLPILPWNVLICASNTINDTVVLGKVTGQDHDWIIFDIHDNRRAAIPIDRFAVGASLFTGWDQVVALGDTESYQGMPVMFILSESGSLTSFVVINSLSTAPSVFQKVGNPLPASSFVVPQQMPKQQHPEDSWEPAAASGDGPHNVVVKTSVPAPPPEAFGGGIQVPPVAPPKAVSFNFIPPTTGTPSLFATVPPTKSAPPLLPLPPKEKEAVVPIPKKEPQQQKQVKDPDLKTLPQGNNSLPSLQQVEDLKRIVEEKRAAQGFTQQEEKDKEETGDGIDMDELLLDVDKFQKRLDLFYKRREGSDASIADAFATIRQAYQEEVLAPLNLAEDFVSNLTATNDVQKQEVNGIKERIFSRYSQLEYARSLADRRHDPRYMELLVSQPMDTARSKKYAEIERMYNYVKLQLAECENFHRLDHVPPSATESQNQNANSALIQGIYQTLANHSRVIKSLAHNLNSMRVEVGLKKVPGVEEYKTFDVPMMGRPTGPPPPSYYEKKPLFKERPVVSSKTSVPFIKPEKAKEEEEFVTWDELTAGLSRVKLNKLGEQALRSASSSPLLHAAKPLKISAKKLEVLTNACSKTVTINVPEGDKNLDGLKDMLAAVKINRAKSRAWIEKLDDSSSTSPITTKIMEEAKPVVQQIPVAKSKSSPTIIPTSTVVAGAAHIPIVNLDFSSKGFFDAAPKQQQTQQQQQPLASSTPIKTPVSSSTEGNSSSSTGNSFWPMPTLPTFTSSPTLTKDSSSGGPMMMMAPMFAAPQPKPNIIATSTATTSTAPPASTKPIIFGSAPPTSTFGTFSGGPPIFSSSVPQQQQQQQSVSSVPAFQDFTTTTTTPKSSTGAPTTLLPTANFTFASQAPGGGGSSPFAVMKPPTPAVVSASSSSVTVTPVVASHTAAPSKTNPQPTVAIEEDKVTISISKPQPTRPVTAVSSGRIPKSVTTEEPTTATGSAPSPINPTTTDKDKTLPSFASIPSFGGLFGTTSSSGASTTTTPPLPSIFGSQIASLPKPKPSFDVAKEKPDTSLTSASSTTTSTPSAPPTTVPPALASSGPELSLPLSTPSNSAFSFGGSLTLTAAGSIGTTKESSVPAPPLPITASTTTTPTVGFVDPTASTPSSILTISSTGSSTTPFFGSGSLTQGLSLTTTTSFGSSSIFSSSSKPQASPSIIPSSSSIFGVPPPAATTTDAVSSPISSSITSLSLGGSSSTPEAKSNPNPASIFGVPASSTTPGTKSLFGGGGFGDNSSASGAGLVSPASIFGQPQSQASSIFGASTAPIVSSSSIFGTPSSDATTKSAFGAFGGGSSAFGTPSPAPPGSTTSTFGGGAVFGSSSPFGSAFAGSGSGSTTGGGIFGGGSAVVAQQQQTSFGSLAQTPQQQTSFGSTPQQQGGGFGGGGGFGSPSIFGSPQGQTSSSAFGSAPVFGGGTPGFGGGGSTFGGGAVFGSSSSPFGSSFTGSNSPPGGAIFGGGVTQQQAPSFGALAQVAPAQGFGGGGGAFGSPAANTSIFGGGQQQQATSPFGQASSPSLFGGVSTPPQQQQQQQQPQSFGGSAFSSWR